MNGGYSRTHIELYVSVVHNRTENYLKKISNFNFGR